jgi:hypothetical protein
MKVGPCYSFLNVVQMNRVFVIFLIIVLFGNSKVFSQQFSNEREKFSKEWQKILEDANTQEFVKKELPRLLKSPKFSDSHFSKMVDACNLFYSKKVPVYPQLFQYMQCWVYQVEAPFSSSFNSQWQNIVKSYLDKEEQLNFFLEFSNNLYTCKAFSNQGDFFWSFEKGDLSWDTEKKLTINCVNGNLICRVIRQKEVVDSIIVYNTSGFYDVFKNKWEGSKGMITWEKVKFDRTKTFANLRSYRLEMNIAQLKVDTVELTTPYFSTPILGKLYDKTIIELNEGENSPQFNSFEKRLKIPDLKENMDYDGGFVLQGDEFIGQGTIENPAKILLKRDGRFLFEISAVNFEMDPQKVISRNAKTKMYYPSGDSLVQPESFIYLDLKKKELSVSAVQKGNQFLPFNDSYFQINIFAPVLNWKLNSPNPYFTYEVGTAIEQRLAYAESFNYFDRALFLKYKGIGGVHPFNLIAKKVKETGKKQMKLADFANTLGQSSSNAEMLLVDLVVDGFVKFNTSTKIVKVEDKLILYVGANSGERDYDNIRILSDFRPLKNSTGNNDPTIIDYFEAVSQRRGKQFAYAVLDLNKLNIRFNEVESVSLSESQHTELILDSAFILMEKNRDLRFCGWLLSGKIEVHTPLSKFDYQDFKVQVLSSDFAFFRVSPLNPSDASSGEMIPMMSSISNFKGELLIDDPLNRSGRILKNVQFPIVKSIEKSYVFYNAKEIVSGAYDSLRFFYALDPFEIDSLDNFKEKGFQLKGKLVSGGIFPELSENLIIMNDYSFGFITSAPSEGYTFYGTESRYKNKIVLSGNGLQGSGSIDFIHSNSISNKLTFLPDSTIGLAKFVNRRISEGIKYPDVQSDLAYICYQPKNDLLKVSSYRESPLELFEQEAQLMGEIRIKKSGMNGRGTLDLKDATLKSELFNFTDFEFDSDLCSFFLRNRFSQRGENPLSIQSDSLKANVSFRLRKGDFTSSGTKRIKFPPNEFYCQMDRFTWFMDGESIDFEKDKKGETSFESTAGIVKNNFYSLNKDQDSLQFKSLSAKYDLKQQAIFCSKVDFVEVGDARIFPDSGSIVVRKSAVLDPLKNAQIVANDVDTFHRFTEANIQIFGRNRFEGICKYPYRDKEGNVTIIPMKSIKFEKKVTIANGEISERDNFKLSKEFDYFGKIDIYSNNKGLLLDGSTRLNHSCKYDRSWMKFADTIDKQNIQIPISEKVVNSKNEMLAVGFLWRDTPKMDSLRIYPSFLSKVEGVYDPILFSSNGYIQFNDKANEFQIGTKKRLNKNDSLSNLLALHLGTCFLTGIGDINLGINYGEVKMDGYGKIEFNPDDFKTAISMNARVSIPISKDYAESLGNKLRMVQEFPELDLKKPNFALRFNFTHWLGAEKADDIFKDYDEDKLKKMPDGLDQTFVLAGLQLESFGSSKGGGRKIEKGIIAKQKQVGLVSVNGAPILKMVDLQMFFNQTYSEESGQCFYFNFDTPAEKKYFMFYTMDKKDGDLGIYSNDDTFKKTISDIKTDKRKTKNFKFDLIKDGDALNLLSKFKGYFLFK